MLRRLSCHPAGRHHACPANKQPGPAILSETLLPLALPSGDDSINHPPSYLTHGCVHVAAKFALHILTCSRHSPVSSRGVVAGDLVTTSCPRHSWGATGARSACPATGGGTTQPASRPNKSRITGGSGNNVPCPGRSQQRGKYVAIAITHASNRILTHSRGTVASLAESHKITSTVVAIKLRIGRYAENLI